MPPTSYCPGNASDAKRTGHQPGDGAGSDRRLPFTRPSDDELSEMRIHYGPGCRRSFVRRGRVVVVMLNAGDKSRQKEDVRRAAKRAAGESLYKAPGVKFTAQAA